MDNDRTQTYRPRHLEADTADASPREGRAGRAMRPGEHPLQALGDTGLLYLVNRTTFHPRGFSLVILNDGEGVPNGFRIDGDGSEPFFFEPAIDAEKFGDVGHFLEAVARKNSRTKREARTH